VKVATEGLTSPCKLVPLVCGAWPLADPDEEVAELMVILQKKTLERQQ